MLLADYSPLVHAADSVACPDLKIDEIAKVRYIHDGDTIHLNDGRKVRLIGIDTPELARDNRPTEPFALEAKQALTSLFRSDSSIKLLHGEDDRDRYGRMLAHAYTGDGVNVELALLEQGLARVINIPPNTRFSACYLEAEERARCDRLGMWQTVRIIEARQLTRQQKGFQLVRGQVKSIDTNSKGVWLNIDDRLTVGIRQQDLPLFDMQRIISLENRSLTVRGWVNSSRRANPFYLRVRHPASIQLTSSMRCR